MRRERRPRSSRTRHDRADRAEPRPDGGRNDDAENDDRRENDGSRFDRLPATAAERTVVGRPTREAVLEWWAERYGIPPGAFDGYTLWERGAGKLWAFRGTAPSPIDVEGLGITFLRTRQDHWKPTTNAVQRFGGVATRNVVELGAEEARRFVAGEDQEIGWDGDWGYLIVAHDLAGASEPLGVGLYLYGELRSQIPKGRQREI